MRSKAAFAAATWFGSGYAPVAPGTAGSLAALLIAIGLRHWLGLSALWIGALGILLIGPGIWAAGVVAKEIGRTDPQIIVIDEVVGQWITIAGAGTLNWKSWLGAFALFRVLDMWKPWPARQLEALHGGTGIVADDVMAGIYGALVLFAAGYLNFY
jgi:phosphatidylglycerophosphatase A